MAQFAKLIERIEAKWARFRNPIRKNWFTEALNDAQAAQQHFSVLELDAADEALRKCLEGITDGNKAHSRKPTFIVAPDGTTTKAQ